MHTLVSSLAEWAQNTVSQSYLNNFKYLPSNQGNVYLEDRALPVFSTHRRMPVYVFFPSQHAVYINNSSSTSVFQ